MMGKVVHLEGKDWFREPEAATQHGESVMLKDKTMEVIQNRCDDTVGPEAAVCVSASHLTELLRVYRLVRDAPVVAVTACNQVPGASDFDHGDLTHAAQKFKPGQRVRLVPAAEDEG